MGEIFEHIFNHPLGLLKEISRIIIPGGLLILTTPNPSTIINAWRMLSDKYSLWGTETFMEEPKIANNQIIAEGDVHYREYRTTEVKHILEKAGFTVTEIRYMSMGYSQGQSLLKRLIKSSLKPILKLRIFASTHYFLAVKGHSE